MNEHACRTLCIACGNPYAQIKRNIYYTQVTRKGSIKLTETNVSLCDSSVESRHHSCCRSGYHGIIATSYKLATSSQFLGSSIINDPFWESVVILIE